VLLPFVHGVLVLRDVANSYLSNIITILSIFSIQNVLDLLIHVSEWRSAIHSIP
jgi:hypothetical protein